MSDNAKPLSLDRLAEIQEQTRDLQLDGLGLVRLQLLHAADKLALVEMLQTVETTEGGQIKSQEDSLRFGVELLSLAIVDEAGRQTFKTGPGRAMLSRLPLGAIQTLTEAAIDLNGLGPGTADQDGLPVGVAAEIEAAKKN